VPVPACPSLIFDWQPRRPITATFPARYATFYSLICHRVRQAVPRRQHRLLANHSLLPSRLFPALFTVSFTFFRTKYQRYFESSYATHQCAISIYIGDLLRGYQDIFFIFMFLKSRREERSPSLCSRHQ